MKAIKTMLGGLLGALALGGCTHSVHMVHVGDFQPYRAQSAGRMVMAKAEQQVILGFVGNTDYVDQAYEKLKGQCPEGQLVGVSTEYMTSHSFLSYYNKIYMKGQCVR